MADDTNDGSDDAAEEPAVAQDEPVVPLMPSWVSMGFPAGHVGPAGPAGHVGPAGDTMAPLPPMMCANCGGQGHVYRLCSQPISSFGIICYRMVDGRAEYLMVQRKDSLSFVEFVRGKYGIQNRGYIMRLLSNMTAVERDRLERLSFDDIWTGFWQNDYNHGFVKEYEQSKHRFMTLRNGFSVAAGPTPGDAAGGAGAAGATTGAGAVTGWSAAAGAASGVAGAASGGAASTWFVPTNPEAVAASVAAWSRPVENPPPPREDLQPPVPPQQPPPPQVASCPCCGDPRDPPSSTFFSLEVALRSTRSTLDDTEYGFPKGRRNINESDVRCARREFSEETGIDPQDVYVIPGIAPFEELFVGSNHVNYRHVYFLARLKGGTSPWGVRGGRAVPVVDPKQLREVKAYGWFEAPGVLARIREANVERRKVFRTVDEVVRQVAREVRQVARDIRQVARDVRLQGPATYAAHAATFRTPPVTFRTPPVAFRIPPVAYRIPPSVGYGLPGADYGPLPVAKSFGPPAKSFAPPPKSYRANMPPAAYGPPAAAAAAAAEAVAETYTANAAHGSYGTYGPAVEGQGMVANSWLHGSLFPSSPLNPHAPSWVHAVQKCKGTEQKIEGTDD